MCFCPACYARDLLDSHLLVVPEPEDFVLCAPQFGRRKLPNLFAVFVFCHNLGRAGRRRDLLVEFSGSDWDYSGAQAVNAFAARNREQPRRKFAARIELTDGLEGSHKAVLSDLFSIMMIAAKLADETVNAGLVAVDELLESFERTLLGLLRQLGIGRPLCIRLQSVQ